MGFGVNCRGADLLNQLKTSEDKLLGRRFPLYIIALATEVDEEALEWIVKYGHAIDSLTSNSIAFITFYNSVNFYAEAHSMRSLFINEEATGGMFRDSCRTISLPNEALFGSHALTKHVKGRMAFPDKAFVQSMTNESDSIARYLGIRATELPCLLFIDDPNSESFYIMPMHTDGKRLFQYLREIVSDFYSNKKHKEYMHLIDQWDEVDKSISATKKELGDAKKELLAFQSEFPKRSIQIDQLLNIDCHEKAYRRLRSWLRRLYGASLPEDIFTNTLMLFNHELFYNYKRLSRFSAVSNDIENIIGSDMTENDKSVKLKRIYRKIVVHLLPVEYKRRYDIRDVSYSELVDILRYSVSDKNTLRAEFYRNLETLRSNIDALNIPETFNENVVRREKSIKNIEQNIINLEKLITDIKSRLDAIARPQIGPILKKMKLSARRRAAISAVGKFTESIGKNAETIFKALDMARKMG